MGSITDLVCFASLNMPADDTATSGGAIDLDTRRGRLTETGDVDVRRATGLNPHHGGRIPPGAPSDSDEIARRERRSDAEGLARQTCARIFNC